jgi:hypothetical protein
MAQLAEHPTVKQFREREAAGNEPLRPQTLDSAWLRQVCLEAGADDVGFVEADRPEIADQKRDIHAVSPWKRIAGEPRCGSFLTNLWPSPRV